MIENMNKRRRGYP